MAEGAPLLREYGVLSLIEGSNPSRSAKAKNSENQWGSFDALMCRNIRLILLEK